MTHYKRGSVVLVPFPFSNQKEFKKRPAVIITSDRSNSIFDDVVIMAITSNTRISDIGEMLVRDWKEAGLLKPSAVKTAISTIEKRLIIKSLGSLSHHDMVLLDTTLREFLDLQQ